MIVGDRHPGSRLRHQQIGILEPITGLRRPCQFHESPPMARQRCMPFHRLQRWRLFEEAMRQGIEVHILHPYLEWGWGDG